MMRHCHALLATSVAVFGGAAITPAASGDLIPRQVFFGNPERASVQVSPAGDQLAYLAPHNDVMNVWVQTIGKDDAAPVTQSKDRPIRIYAWAENGEQIIYLQDKGGDENWRLYAVDLETGKETDLTPFEGVQARIMASDRDHPDDILVGVNNRNPQLHDVYRINTRTGERELVLQNDEGWIGFLADSDYNVRLAVRMTADGGQEVFRRDLITGEWKPFITWDQQDTMNSSPLQFSRDGETLYIVDAHDRDKAALYAVDPADATSRELIFSSDDADITSAVMHPETGRPQAVSWEFARREWKVLDDNLRADWEHLKTLEDGELSITSRDHDDDTWTVAYITDDGPVKYYLYDRDQQEATYLFSNRPELEKYDLAKMKPVVIESRDGLKLVSYLTLPTGASSSGAGPAAGAQAQSLPMILLVHGGPWARDSWGYNSLHQWLANRGYAVLSVNYRGSTGFGKAFVNAANYEWSGKMHDDLIDAVNWAIEEGIADPDRVAIMGGSYGGYATLVGLTFTPEVFAAGVDIVGPSHVKTLLESIPPYWKPVLTMFTSRVGSLDDPEYLDSISPLTKVENIEDPLLIGQGANDPRVKQAESEQIVDAMQEKGIPVTYVVFPDEGHGFARPVNSMAFFAITEAFLAQHLGGAYEPVDDAVRKSTAEVKAGAELVPGLDAK